jgi:hypothetical protein
MKRIYVSLTAALHDLYRLRTTLEDIDCVVSNTSFPSLGIVLAEYAAPDSWLSTRNPATAAMYLTALWPRIIQPRELWPSEIGAANRNSHYGGHRFFEVPPEVELNCDADRIAFVYTSIWNIDGWVWDYCEASDERKCNHIRAAIEELRIRQSTK